VCLNRKTILRCCTAFAEQIPQNGKVCGTCSSGPCDTVKHFFSPPYTRYKVAWDKGSARDVLMAMSYSPVNFNALRRLSMWWKKLYCPTAATHGLSCTCLVLPKPNHRQLHRGINSVMSLKLDQRLDRSAAADLVGYDSKKVLPSCCQVQVPILGPSGYAKKGKLRRQPFE
jgi:hypothetical protein